MDDMRLLANALAIEVFGMTKGEALRKGICLNCKKPMTTRGSEYLLSGICDPCWDEMFKEDNEFQES